MPNITPEMIEVAVAEVRKAKDKAVWDRWTDHDAVEAMLTAALSVEAGAAPEASETVQMHRTRHKISELAGWSTWSRWEEGYGKTEDPTFEIEIENRLFYLHPAPAPAVEGWRPMDSAPTKTEGHFAWPCVIGFTSWGSSQHVGPMVLQPTGHWEFTETDFDIFPSPTHWQPLPAAPTPQTEGDRDA